MKKFKIRYKRVLIFLLIIVILILCIVKLLTLRITNIYVSGNSYLNDQYIIEHAEIDNYPYTFFNTSSSIEKRLKSNDYIKDVKVSKKKLTHVYIKIEENRPLFYDVKNNNTVLLDGKSVTDFYNIPILLNSVPSDIYSEFIEKMGQLDIDILSNISEILYKPNDVDSELFLLTMNDGNYIYVNLDKFISVNKYFDMVINFNNHKGILYLDSGEYFKILDN